MAEEQAQQTATKEAPAQAPATEAPQLSIADLQALMNIIDVASSRGAFRANELSNVGGIADKLTKFLQHVADQQKAQAEEKAKAEGGAIDEGKIGDAQPAQAAPEQK
mgnify:FL=1|tara:strand:- start:311 stop:631 length:321 start_codon:yes stop_codon:yes gene_type:complete